MSSTSVNSANTSKDKDSKEKDKDKESGADGDNFDQFDDDEPELHYGATASGRKRIFSKELRCMMFGFGDDQNPYTESVDLLEDLVIEYITDMVTKISQIDKRIKESFLLKHQT